MTKPTALIPWTPGTNCHREMAYAFELAGAKAVIKPLKTLLHTEELSKCDLLAFAGGFSWGDHFWSGHVAALDLVTRFRDHMHKVLERKIPILGVCNGFQILVEMGLLPGGAESFGNPNASLDFNLQNRFEHWSNTRLVLHEPPGKNSVWTKDLDGMVVSWPSAHGEGRLETDRSINVVATYGTKEGDPTYPVSPNGSPIAGITDDSGLITGFMPHPERRVDNLHGGSDGLPIFEAGVKAVR